MRHTVRSAGILSLFLLNLTNLSAEPLVRGFFIDKLPEKAVSKELSPGKGLVLAHVFNSGKEHINMGSYQVGVEIENAGKKRTFVLNPKESIVAGSLKTFRMAVPVSGIDKSNGQFRVFSKVNGSTVWSEKYSFLSGVQSEGNKKITTLYTEAPPEASSIIPPREVPFENEKTAQKAVAQEKAAKIVSQGKKAGISKETKLPETVKLAKLDKLDKPDKAVKSEKAGKPEKAEKTAKLEKAVKPDKEVKSDKAIKADEQIKPVKQDKPVKPVVEMAKVEEAPAQRARDIDLSEFKKLRTIDEELIIYVIKDGDSLKSIAEKYYGAATKERTIADLNFIEKPSSIKVGEEIIVDVRPLGKSGKNNG